MVTQVIDQVPRVQFTATGGQTIFAYNFLIFLKTDITVEQNGVPLAVDVDFTVSGVGVITGGNITLTSGATANDIITVYRSQNFDREVDYQESGDFLSETINDDINRAILMLQQNRESLSRSLQYAIDDTVGTIALPLFSDRINKFLGFDVGGNPIALTPTFASGTTQVVSSIALLKGLTPSNGDSAFVSGYYNASDGGGGHYQFDLTSVVADNGGTVIAPTVGSGRWILAVTIGGVTDRQFGAVGDGVTNDTVAIQAAMTAAAGRTFFSSGSGTFLMDSINIVSNTNIVGRGAIYKAKIAVGNGAEILSITDSSSNVRIQDMNLDGDRSNQTFESGGISIGSACSDIKINHNTIDEVSGAFLAIANTAHDIDIIGNTWTHSDLNGINSSAVFNIKVIGNTITLDTGSTIAGCIEFDNGAHDLLIDGNILSAPTTQEQCIQVEDGSFNARIVNNQCTGGSQGIFLGAPGGNEDVNSVISGNTCIGAGTDGIFLDKADNCTISNNVTHSNGADGIDVSGSDNCVIIGNVSFNNSQVSANRFGMVVSACDNCTIVGNNCFDTQGAPTQLNGLLVTSGSENTVVGNTGTGNISTNVVINEVDGATRANFNSETEVRQSTIQQNGPITMSAGPNDSDITYGDPPILTATGAVGDVSIGNAFEIANAVPTTVVFFNGGTDGKPVHIVFNNSNTTIDFTGTSMKGNGGVDWTPNQFDSMIMTKFDGKWICQISNN